MYDAVFRPDRPPSPPGSLLVGDTETKKQPKYDGVGGDTDDAESGGGGGGVKPFLPDERLTLEEAVWMYTVGGALAAGAEDRLGAIRPGLLADLTVVEVEGGGQRFLEDPRLSTRHHAVRRTICELAPSLVEPAVLRHVLNSGG